MNNQKGFAPIVIALIVAVVLGGGYAVVKTNPGIAKKFGIEKQVEKKETNTSEISVRGVVVDNNLENQNIGAYLQVKRNDSAEDIFVVYKPFVDMKESPCLNKIEAYTIGVGTSIEVKGLKIDDMNGIKPKGLMISTCESEGYYIRTATGQTAKVNITIMVPSDMVAYEKAMDDYIFNGKPNPAKTWTFVPETVSIAATTDVIPASVASVAKRISTQGGAKAAHVAYLKVTGGTAYVLLGMHLDGWAGVSASLAKIQPLIEKTLLQFPGIASVKFTPAPGDTMEEILKEYISSTAITSQPDIKVISPNGGENWKIGQTYSISTLSAGELGTRTIRLNRYSDDGVRVGSEIIGTTEANTFSYKVPVGTEDTKGNAARYKIQILVNKYDSGKGVADESDNYFAITN